jgi:hypothetical protein
MRKALGDLARSFVKPREADREERALPLIFIIDELDRCRPTFALELLEKIKHIFAIRDLSP